MQILEPQKEWLSRFAGESLRSQQGYSIETLSDVQLKLDQNEMPFDWSESHKDAVLKSLRDLNWNRYPESFTHRVNELLARYSGVPSDCVITSPGANLLITMTMDAFASDLKGDLVIARPSFPLYESHAAWRGLNYQTWNLDSEFQYQAEDLNNLRKGSAVFFASPNNPIGNALPKSELQRLLALNPDSFFVADEAYFEFADENYTDLLAQFSNLFIIRTCSKVLGAAGLRLGYGLGSKALIAELRKTRLPYLLNHFTCAAAEVFLGNDYIDQIVKANTQLILQERKKLFEMLTSGSLAQSLQVTVVPSSANFLFLKFISQQAMQNFYEYLQTHGVLVRNVSRSPGVNGAALRLSIGTPAQNQRVSELLHLYAESVCAA